MYKPNPLADNRATRLIRALLIALLASPLFCACATARQEAHNTQHEAAQPIITQTTNPIK